MNPLDRILNPRGSVGVRSNNAGSLLSVLDFNQDGSVVDDLLGMAKKFF